MNADREIGVVNRDVLFEKHYFEGFVKLVEFDYETVILDNYEWMKKIPAERNNLFKQPIGYTIICNKLLNKVFVYKRASKNRYAEKKLWDKYSCGVGGHIERIDADSSNPIYASTLRELDEEVKINPPFNLKKIGYVNNEDKVGIFHFGILYLVETNSEEVAPTSPEIASGKWRPIHELEEICNNPEKNAEPWTKIVLEPLKGYLDDNT